METNYIKGASPLTPYPHSFWWFTDEKVLAIMVTADDVLRWSHRSGFFQRVRPPYFDMGGQHRVHSASS